MPGFKLMERLRSLGQLACGRLRARLLALRGARIGHKTAVGARCAVWRPWCISLGDRVLIESDVYMKLVHDQAQFAIGDHVFVGRGVEFDVMLEVRIGHHTLIAPNCFICDHSHAFEPGRRIDEQACIAKAVSIGEDVWIGAGSVILAGVSIGDGAVIGANSVVTSNVAPMTVVAGSPARLLRGR